MSEADVSFGAGVEVVSTAVGDEAATAASHVYFSDEMTVIV